MEDLNKLTPSEIVHAFFNELEAINQRLASIENELKTFTPLQHKEILTLEETSEYLSLSKSYLYKLTSKREIPYYKTGKKIYFKREQLDEYLTKIRIKSNQEIDRIANEYIMKNPLKWR